MSLPDAPNRHNPDPEYLRALLKESGLTQEQAAERIGVAGRSMRDYLKKSGGTKAPYSVQYCLERLATRRRQR